MAVYDVRRHLQKARVKSIVKKNGNEKVKAYKSLGSHK